MENYLSHPHKSLKTHIDGVCKIYQKYCQSQIGLIAAKFHDLGKLNPNFQLKIKGKTTNKYSHHSYLSALFLLQYVNSNKFLATNSNDLCYALNSKIHPQETVDLRLLQIITMITKHHGSLPNLGDLTWYNRHEIEDSEKIILQNQMPAVEFLEQVLYVKVEKMNTFESIEDDYRQNISFKKVQGLWESDPLKHFTETQYAFASLIAADKRDASDNNQFFFEENLDESINQLHKGLKDQFALLETSSPNELNKIRTEIRLNAIENLNLALSDNQRVFSLTAPTGSGKTFTLLALASEIQKKHKVGIIYCLPFLSIIEQVEDVLKNLDVDFLAVNSKSINEELNEAIERSEGESSMKDIKKMFLLNFAELSFDHPLIVTTFVQFFETLVSNQNSKLLKLPNFSHKIFIIDEIQALPPRLYIFFTALLDDFCKKHNSFAILSTGTMPNFNLPEEKHNPIYSVKGLFKEYQGHNGSIYPLIDAKKYFALQVFNRYKINNISQESIDIDQLANHIQSNSPCSLVVLNTIDDTKNLYNLLVDKMDNVILINTHFRPKDRSDKIEKVKELLAKNQDVVFISTQLIEAGVDIDFPVVYRDRCPLPNLIQSAGRCNRNNKNKELGQVYTFALLNANGKLSYELVYEKSSGLDKSLLPDDINENQIFSYQEIFFDKLNQNLEIGAWDNENLIEHIYNASFANLGNFQLISKSKFGQEHQYFIKDDENDMRYDNLVKLMLESLKSSDLHEKQKYKIKIKNDLKKIADSIVTIRVKKNENAPMHSNAEKYFDLMVLSDLGLYCKDTGLDLSNENCIF